MFLDLIVRQLLTTVAPLVITAVTQAHQTPPNQPLPPVPAQVQEGAVEDVLKQQVEQNTDLQPLPWYFSRGMWGAIVAIAAPLVGVVLKREIDAPQQQMILDVIMSGIGVVGGLVALYGRATAKRSISLGRPTV